MAENSFAKPIETAYSGCRFRSRLEARWAVFFDTLGIAWEYEPGGFELGPKKVRYLPDFWLPKMGIYVEVKPESFWGVLNDPSEHPDIGKMCSLALFGGKRVGLVIGLPIQRPYPLFESWWVEVNHVNQLWFAFVPDSYRASGEMIPRFPLTSHDPYNNALSYNDIEAILRWLCDEIGYEDAINAARAARFEFGEEG